MFWTKLVLFEIHVLYSVHVVTNDCDNILQVSVQVQGISGFIRFDSNSKHISYYIKWCWHYWNNYKLQCNWHGGHMITTGVVYMFVVIVTQFYTCMINGMSQ